MPVRYLILALIGCSSSSTPVARAQAQNTARVSYVGADGLLACAWNDTDEAFRAAMPQLGPALAQCADEERVESGTWLFSVSVSTSGVIERSSLAGARLMTPPSGSITPPACAVAALRATRLRSGPPSCGSVLIVRFEVSPPAHRSRDQTTTKREKLQN